MFCRSFVCLIIDFSQKCEFRPPLFTNTCMCVVLSATLSSAIHFDVKGISHILSYCTEIRIITMSIVCTTLNTRSLRCDIKGSRARQKSYRFRKIIENIMEKKEKILWTSFRWLPDIITCLHDNRHVFTPLFYLVFFSLSDKSHSLYIKGRNNNNNNNDL